MNIGSFEPLIESWERIKGSDKSICIYGTGNACERILERFAELGIKVSGIFASDGFVRNRDFAGFHVKSLSQLEEELGDFLVCCAFGSSLPDVMGNMNAISKRHEFVFPDLPIAGEEFFSKKGLLDRFDDLLRVYDRLADDRSREVMQSVLSFRLTGDIDYLTAVFSDPDDEFRRLIQPTPTDSYADLGAYNGDTAERFIQLAGGYEHIYAFEPDLKSFRKCEKRLEAYRDITLINAAAWSSDGSVPFMQSAGRQSKIGGKQLIAARTLDSVVGDKPCTVIKYDVEGAESEAIDGSVKTIRRNRPRLAVSAYHRPYDLIDLPLKLWELVPEYRVYLRQPPYYPAWDTMIYASAP